MKRAVLVNGVPASGKSTVARAVSAKFGWPLLGLDAIKEPFFEQLGMGDREYNRKLGRASYAAIFNLIAAFPAGSTAVIDAWFGFQPLDVLSSHLAHAEISDVVEIWCYADPRRIGDRYAARVTTRPAGHPGLDYVPELIALAGRAQPTGLFAWIGIDTDRPLDEAGLLTWLTEQFGLYRHDDAGRIGP